MGLHDKSWLEYAFWDIKGVSSKRDHRRVARNINWVFLGKTAGS